MLLLLPHQFKALLETIQADLSSIQNAIREQTRTIRISEAERYSAYRHRQKTYRQRQILNSLTAAIALGAFIYAGIGACQLKTMRGALEEIQKQTTAVQNTLTEVQKQTALMKKQMAGTFGGELFTESPQPTQIPGDTNMFNHTGIFIHFRNIGKTDVVEFVAAGIMTRQNIVDDEPLGEPQYRHIGPIRIRPYQEGSQDNRVAELRFETNAFTPHDLDLIRESKETIDVSGIIQYGDGFGDTDNGTFCYHYYAPSLSSLRSDGKWSTIRGRWSECGEPH